MSALITPATLVLALTPLALPHFLHLGDSSMCPALHVATGPVPGQGCSPRRLRSTVRLPMSHHRMPAHPANLAVNST
jgi:hypothetical protein